MELPALPVASFQAFLVCLVRVGALIAAMPVFGNRQAPPQVKIGLAVLLALLVFPLVEGTIPRFDFEPLSLGLLLAREVLVGAAAGLTAQLIFTAVEFGGAVIGYKMGFAAANIFDPTHQQQTQLLSQFQGVLAILVFLAVDGHHVVLQALVHSFQALPPGTADFTGGSAELLMRFTAEAFVLGLKISAPVLAVLILVGLILGVMSRIFPQLNVFMLSFPIKIGIAFLIMGLTFQIMAALLTREFGLLEGRFMALFDSL